METNEVSLGTVKVVITNVPRSLFGWHIGGLLGRKTRTMFMGDIVDKTVAVAIHRIESTTRLKLDTPLLNGTSIVWDYQRATVIVHGGDTFTLRDP